MVQEVEEGIGKIKTQCNSYRDQIPKPKAQIEGKKSELFIRAGIRLFIVKSNDDSEE